MRIPNGKGRHFSRLVMTIAAMTLTSAAGFVVACGSDTPATPADDDGGTGLDGSLGRDTADPPDQPEPDGGVFRTPNADAGCPLKYAGPRNGGVTASVPRTGVTTGIVWENAANALTVDNQFARAVLDDDQQSELLRITSYGFNLPATVSIKGIVVQLKRKGDNKIVDGNIQLWLDGIASARPKFVASGWPVNTGTHHYGQEVDTWGNDLTPAIVNSPGFGTEIWARRREDAGTGPIAGEVESLIITVWYCE